MKAITLAVATLLFACVPVACGPKARDDSENKLLGVWEVVGDHDITGSTVEFTREGKLKVVDVYKGRKDFLDGTYTVDGDILKVVLIHPVGGKKEVKEPCRITELTHNDLVTEDEKGRVERLKRVH